MGTNITEAIRRKALESGFCAVGFARPTLSNEIRRSIKQFVAEGLYGDMGWLAEKADLRSRPQNLWAEAKSVIALAFNYAPDHDPMENLKQADRGNISVYARNRDYHLLGKGMLKRFAARIAADFDCRVKVFLDTAPVMEKPLAAKAGIGWQGKHTNLVSKTFGSWLFLGEIFTTLELGGAEPLLEPLPEPPHKEHCGSCRACIDICPTNALDEWRINPKKCISYLTIEHKGMIPHRYRRLIGNRIYGCDDCLAVCPWNKFAKLGDPGFRAKWRDQPPLGELLQLDDAAFRRRFSASAVKRTGRNRFLRNVLIAAGNSGDRSLLPKVRGLLADESWLVRAAAVWALGRLGRGDRSQSVAKPPSEEKDRRVLVEWRRLENPTVGA